MAVGYAQESKGPIPRFSSLEEWEQAKSTKMDVVAQIIRHMLSSDQAPPVTFVDGVPIFPSIPISSDEEARFNKVAVFQDFPSLGSVLRNVRVTNNLLMPAEVIQVLELYGIEHLYIDGQTSYEKRSRIVHQFNTDCTVRVLIFSSVGSVGLNLARANTIIFLDQPWSAQDERQIRGRVHRQPQKLKVYSYHILAKDTADIILSEQARGKRDMMEAFLSKEKGQELYDLFSGKSLLHENDDDIEEPRDIDHSKATRRKGKTKALPNIAEEPLPTLLEPLRHTISSSVGKPELDLTPREEGTQLNTTTSCIPVNFAESMQSRRIPQTNENNFDLEGKLILEVVTQDALHKITPSPPAVGLPPITPQRQKGRVATAAHMSYIQVLTLMPPWYQKLVWLNKWRRYYPGHMLFGSPQSRPQTPMQKRKKVNNFRLQLSPLKPSHKRKANDISDSLQDPEPARQSLTPLSRSERSDHTSATNDESGNIHKAVPALNLGPYPAKHIAHDPSSGLFNTGSLHTRKAKSHPEPPPEALIPKKKDAPLKGSSSSNALYRQANSRVTDSRKLPPFVGKSEKNNQNIFRPSPLISGNNGNTLTRVRGPFMSSHTQALHGSLSHDRTIATLMQKGFADPNAPRKDGEQQ
ncbi:hypothetical protein CVT26_001000 [Gymnopilus dilepis]|uniref:Helicase C-terminal domain-containing protein n=1 Tax=Gymnopilus dilepis TaxID=231916 RepID=A0A409WVW3_9AGAR|nr:hypothetical protein CVT26_001000 [Gymnopilus dilepis]